MTYTSHYAKQSQISDKYKCKTVNTLEENMQEIVVWFDLGKISLAITLKLQSKKEKWWIICHQN